MFDSDYGKWPGFESLEALAEQLDLPCDPEMQDWEIEVADPKRIGEFLEFYASAELEPPQRVALCQLILASLDEALTQGFGAGYTEQVANILRGEPALHAYTILYWSCEDETDPDRYFPATPMVREVRDEVRDKLPS